MDNKESLLKHCVNYFKITHGFKRIFQKIKEKYESLGNLGGTIVLTNLKEDEKEALTGFFRKDYYRKSATIKVENFIKALSYTKFSGVNFEEVLKEYFGEELISKKQQKNIYEQEKKKYFTKILSEYKGSRAEEWFKYILESKENAYRIINQKYDENKLILENNLHNVFKAYNNLTFDENNVTRLALFSSSITKNPHSFDDNTDCGKLLVYAICYKFQITYPENAEELNETIYRAGIIRDEVSNFTLCSSVVAYAGGKLHEGWKGFYERNEPLQVNLWNISKIEKVISPRGKVFVFENPTVFSEVLYRTIDKKPSLMCTFGNFKLASLILLDKLVHSGAIVYYSGDFDPEGIIMADKLKKRYGEKLVLWRYDEGEYLNIKSSVQLSASRMKKLESVKSKELEGIIKVLKEHKFAAYQEMIIDRYVEDIILSSQT